MCNLFLFFVCLFNHVLVCSLSLFLQIRHFPRGRRMLPLGGIDEMPDPVDRAYGAETEHSGLRDMDGFESMEDWFNEQSKDDNFIRTIERYTSFLSRYR